MDKNKGISFIVVSFVLFYVLILPLILFHFRIKENNRASQEYNNEVFGKIENNKGEKMGKKEHDDACDTACSFLAIIPPSYKNWIGSKINIDFKSKSFVIAHKRMVFWGSVICTAVAVLVFFSPVIVFFMKCAWFEAAEMEDIATLEALPFSWSKRFINVVDGQGNTALHRACHRDALKSVKYLMKKGINRGLINIAGSNARDLAQQAGHTSLYSYLGRRRKRRRKKQPRVNEISDLHGQK